MRVAAASGAAAIMAPALSVGFVLRHDGKAGNG